MRRFAVAALAVAIATAGVAQGRRPVEELRPGALLLCGGGELPAAILERFAQLAGGKRGHLVIIPTAQRDAGDPAANVRLQKPWKRFGFASVQMLHTRDRAEAQTAAFVAPVKEATGVWIQGGQQSRIAGVMPGTAVEDELRALLDRGGVIGGTSAGAAIQVRLMIAGGRDVPKIAVGFDLLPGCVVDQHFTARKRLPRLRSVIDEHPDRVGFGIDERTALLVEGRRIQILGAAGVTVYLAASKTRKARTEAHRAGTRLDLVTLRNAARFRARAVDHAFQPGVPQVPAGTCILVGGGKVPQRIWRRFLAAAGGNAAPIVVIPTAAGSRRPGRATVRLLERLGAQNVTLLHATARKNVESEAFLGPLRKARGIWFGGGRQWRLVDAYAGTQAMRLFRKVLRRGGAIGGSSAGTSIQAEFMARGDPLGNRVPFIEGYELGFGFLPGVAVDQHFSQRRRFKDMELLVKTYPKVLGIGIDESTAIVVQKDGFEVLGGGQVFVYDPSKSTTLRQGQSYDLAKRRRRE